MTINGRTITWDIPVGDEGPYPVEVTVSDTEGGTDSQSYTLTVSANQPPVFTSTPVTTGSVGQP